MSIKINCPSCQKRYKVPENISHERKMRCNQCQTKFSTGEAIQAAEAEENEKDLDSKTAIIPDQIISQKGELHIAPTPSASQDKKASTPEPFPDEEQTSKAPNLIGRTLGDCRLDEKIGEGGMGSIYKAHHKNLDITVAVKVLTQKFADKGAKYTDRFVREARAAAKLQHQNVIGVLNVDDSQGIYYITMQYVEGKNLKQLVKANGAFSPTDAVDIMKQTCLALQFAMDNKIVHRDIKPDNIMVDAEGVAKLADLGLAKQLDCDQNNTQSDAAMGTPAYMSPEQATNFRHADIRSDLYAIGCTLYYMLSGKNPYRAKSIGALLKLHDEAPIPDVCELDDTIPPRLSSIIKRLMAKHPDDRFQSPNKLREALEKVNTRKKNIAKNTPTASARLRKKKKGIGYHLMHSIILLVLVAGLGAALRYKFYRKPGLNYTYYKVDAGIKKLPDFTKLSPDGNGIAPQPSAEIGNQQNNFAVVYTGFFNAKQLGDYTFTLISDDGARLIMNDQKLINIDGLHGKQKEQSTVTLQTKGEHSLRIEYFQESGDRHLELRYKGPGLKDKVITQLSCRPKTVFDPLFK